jgi:putative FmdB family regulatory protein
MPIYEYQCKACKKDFEELVFGDESVKCPECGSAKTAKLMSCCRHKSGGPGGIPGPSVPSSGGGGGCSGCSGGSCSTCH